MRPSHRRAHHDESLPRALPRRLHAVAHVLAGFRRTASHVHRTIARASRGAISAADAAVLQFLLHRGSANAGEVAAFTGLTSGSVTSMIDRLEAAALVRRSRDPTDRRVVHVLLRPKGKRQMLALLPAAHAEAQRMFEGWRTAEIEQLAWLLNRLRIPSDPGDER